MSAERQNEFWGIFFIALSVLLFVSLSTHHPDDLAFFTSHPSAKLHNLCGLFGAMVSGVVRSALGLTGYLLSLLGFIWAIARFQGKTPPRLVVRLVSVAVFCLGFSALLSITWNPAQDARVYRGGVLGLWVGDEMVHYFGWWGAVGVLLTISILSFLLVTEMAVWPMMSVAGRWLAAPTQWIGSRLAVVLSPTQLHRKADALRSSEISEPNEERERSKKPAIRILGEEEPRFTRPAETAAPAAPKPSAEKVEAPSTTTHLPYRLPSLDLLNLPSAPREKVQGKDWLENNARILEEALRDFGIDAKVAEVEMGPVITRYEVEPAPGVKVQKITTLSDDLALVMKAPSVRVIAPIPGKARVGIEVPNPSSSQVTLREVLESPEFQEASSKVTLAFGKDSAGHPLTADLSEMPHLLIAGTTGSGKTVCMNAIITSILFKATPDEVRFLMVDPKMVELSIFNGLPHLMMPVLTNPKKVPIALQWVVDEMETRYRLFSKLGVRNIEAYHDKRLAGQLPAEEIPESLPYLVVIIDELADLMLTAQAEVEKAIARLAHLSRAVGIHMILATQRPSVDVLTGVIKANFPARISFQVASRVDSRTVLDTMGAEKLLGKGDFLFMQPGSSKLTRAQGTLVTDAEIERITQFWKAQGAPLYDSSILEEAQSQASVPVERVKDVLYDEAVRVIIETGQASVSLLQRRMRLGYGRAARILDMMQEEGIVGPIRGAKPREVFLKEVPIREVVG